MLKTFQMLRMTGSERMLREKTMKYDIRKQIQAALNLKNSQSHINHKSKKSSNDFQGNSLKREKFLNNWKGNEILAA